MTTAKNIDTKREEFRKYLEKEGVLESLTKALVNWFCYFWILDYKFYIFNFSLLFQVALYEEPDKPSDALAFVRNNFASSELTTLKAQLENLTQENEQLKSKVTSLEKAKSELESKVQNLENLQKQSETGNSVPNASVSSPQPEGDASPKPQVEEPPKPSEPEPTPEEKPEEAKKDDEVAAPETNGDNAAPKSPEKEKDAIEEPAKAAEPATEDEPMEVATADQDKPAES